MSTTRGQKSLEIVVIVYLDMLLSVLACPHNATCIVCIRLASLVLQRGMKPLAPTLCKCLQPPAETRVFRHDSIRYLDICTRESLFDATALHTDHYADRLPGPSAAPTAEAHSHAADTCSSISRISWLCLTAFGSAGCILHDCGRSSCLKSSQQRTDAFASQLAT